MASSGNIPKISIITAEAYPWVKQLNRGARAHALRVKMARMHWSITRTDRAVQGWWQSRLDAAFAEGYRESLDQNGQ